MTGRWQFWIDRGGTFTDVVALGPDGALRTAKLLSEDPHRAEDAAAAAIRQITGCGNGPLPPADVRIGTTVATNALLERTGEPVLLAITRGFGDLPLIGSQERPDIFARAIVRPPPVHAAVVEIDERVAADGAVLRPLDEDAAREALAAAHARGLRAVAIVLAHGYRHTAHEQRLAAIARAVGFTQVTASHEAGALIGLVGRGDTAVADAYLSPVLRRYVDGLAAALGAAPLFMQSSGGLAHGGRVRGKDAVLSGPAGGVVGMARTAAAAGYDRVIGFDMGGTSTDVSLHAGRFEQDGEAMVAGVRIRAPMLRIHTVAAGGGSVCRWADGRLTVGPESAGAVPGPACYGRGGPLTVSDCNLVLGKLDPAHFPHLFGANGDAPLDRAAAQARLDAVAAQAGLSPDACAEGLLRIAIANMANAIKTVSVGRGHDAAGFALNCFGGAGGQHACLVADALGIGTVLVHPLAGVLSAFGIGLADRRATRERTLAVPLAERVALDAAAAALAANAAAALADEGVDPAAIRTEATALLRYGATDDTIAVTLGEEAAMRAAFDAAHRARFGYTGSGALVVDTVRVSAIADTPAPTLPPPAAERMPPLATVEALMAGRRRATPVHRRAGIAAGDRVDGPALVVDETSTTVVEPGWSATTERDGMLLLTRTGAAATAAVPDADPVRLEIFAGLFTALAEEMGAALRHSASSVNIRERLDFSCALFDGDGGLVANAPHIPVHLGSMGASVRAVQERYGAPGARGLRPGDAFALNDPYRGGTHLPDITVVMPVFAGGSDAPAFFVAARGHHADVGGTTPGSMPPDSRSIEGEGVVLDLVLVEDGRFRERAVRDALATGPCPARNVDMNIADLRAQLAACARGAAGLERLCAEHGAALVAATMRHLHAHSEAAVRRAIGRLGDGRFAVELDSGATVAVAVAVDRDAGTLRLDFSGTSAQQPGNHNAPRAVVRAAVLYATRLLLDEPVPMNEGCLAPVEIVIPAGSMLDPRAPAAVVAGNVEVSQAVTDALLGAMGAMAASQGTMNNFTFGDDHRQYYETICGGAGAGPGFAGANAVQTHMTNSRMTDPEVLETRFPVLVERFAIRRGSGGAGAFPGGDGAVRRVRFLHPMRAAILANRRRIAPFGLAGGGDAQPGATRVERADGRVEPLGSTAAAKMAPGDVFVIETPGGGGYGAPR